MVRTQSPVALAISSPTFLGERPRGPILGARAEEAPTSPPVARRWLYYHHVSIVWLIDHKFEIARSNRCCDGFGEGEQACVHDLHLIGVELGSCAPSSCQYSGRCWGPTWESNRVLTHIDWLMRIGWWWWVGFVGKVVDSKDQKFQHSRQAKLSAKF